MSDEERARDIVRGIRFHSMQDEQACRVRLASALSAARDEERDRVVAWLRDNDGVGPRSFGAFSIASAIAANQHREPKT